MTGDRPASRAVVVSLFRYSLHDHEAMANTYPHVLVEVGRTADVHHFCSRGTVRHWAGEQPGVHIHELPIRFRRGRELDKWIKTFLWYFIAIRAAWWARRHGARLVYIEESLPLLPAIVAAVSGCPVAMSAADVFWDVYLPDKGLAGFLKRALISVDVRIWKRLRGLVTHTQAFKDHATKLGVSSGRVYVVPEACEQTMFHHMDRSAARAAAGYAAGEEIILHHGMLVPNKALDRMLDYIAPVLRSRPTARIEFAGDGPSRRALELRTRSLGIADQVRFLGWLPDVASLNTLLNAADISVIMREGRFSDHFQVTANLLHSLACGCTILAARLGGIAELVQEGHNGLLFDPRDGEEFRRQLRRLLEDAPLRRRLADEAIRTASTRLDPRTITASWAAALRSLMQPEGSP